jgi:hypothetical protein
MDESLGGPARVRVPLSLEPGVEPLAPTSRGLLARVMREQFILLVLAAEALVLAVRLPDLVVPDTWLALVAGRDIATGGLPQHDTLFIWSHGVRWVDQQWLGQLFMYGLQSAGGLRLLLLVHTGALVSAFALALMFARRSGGSSRSVALVGALGVFVAFPNSAVRTQAFAFVFFVAVFWLLARDIRRPSRRVFFVLPLLVLWANVHGSVVLGAALVVLWAAATLVRAGLRAGAGFLRLRVAVMTVAAPLSLLVSPYAFGLPGYYRSVIGAPAFRHFVNEWAPSTFPSQWPFFALAVPALWLTAREAKRLNLFEHLALLFTLAAGLVAVRNIAWFALVAVMVVPRALDGVWPPDRAPFRKRVNRILSAAALAALLGAFVAVAARPLGLSANGYSSAGFNAVSRASSGDPSLRVFATERYSDWLIWNAPTLAGRVAFDARFELLTSRQIKAIANFHNRSSPDWLAPAAGYRLFVLDPEESAFRSILHEPGVRRLYRDRAIAVLLRNHG